MESNRSVTLSTFQIEQEAKDPEWAIPVRLVMHGIPEEWVDKATGDQLMILYQILQDDLQQNEITTANGIGLAFGGGKSGT